jgi:hypothetical protein
MELPSVTPQSIMASKAAQIQSQFAMAVTRNAIEAMQTEGQMLVQLVAQAAGVGQNINTSA